MRTSKRLFKINSQVRDYDIICEKLQKYSPEPIYTIDSHVGSGGEYPRVKVTPSGSKKFLCRPELTNTQG